MDAAHDTDTTPVDRRLRAGILRFVLCGLLVCSASAAHAQSQANARPISPPNSLQTQEQTGESASSNGRSIGTTIAALGAILLLFLGVVQIWRRASPQAGQTLPAAAWEILGSAPLDNRHQLMVVRLGSRLLVLGRSDEGLQTLSEITSGNEVSQLVALCQSANATTEKNSFRQLYENFRSQIGAGSQEPAAPSSNTQGERRRA